MYVLTSSTGFAKTVFQSTSQAARSRQSLEHLSIGFCIGLTGNRKNKMMKAIESSAVQNEKSNHEKTKDLCGIALGIRVTQNATESGNCARELVTGSVEKREIGIREAEAMLLEKPVSHDQKGHPVIFAQESTIEEESEKDWHFAKESTIGRESGKDWDFAQESTMERESEKDWHFGEYCSYVGGIKGCARKIKLRSDDAADRVTVAGSVSGFEDGAPVTQSADIGGSTETGHNK